MKATFSIILVLPVSSDANAFRMRCFVKDKNVLSLTGKYLKAIP